MRVNNWPVMSAGGVTCGGGVLGTATNADVGVRAS